MNNIGSFREWLRGGETDEKSINESFSLNTAATKLSKKLDVDVEVRNGKLFVPYYQDYRTGKYEKVSKDELKKSFNWVNKFFNIKDLGGPVRDEGIEGSDLTYELKYGTWELTPNNTAPVKYEHLESDLLKLPKEALIAIKDSLSDVKEFSKLLDKIIKINSK